MTYDPNNCPSPRMTEQTFLVCTACGTAACADGRHLCDQAGTAPLEWADTPYPKDEDEK